tara:strand:- start:998 stop:1831 length:834 start_codon:yes stop_codon:yes gene_type:complete
MQKNTASQKFIVFAFNTTTNLPVTGDAANITATISKEFAADVSTNDVNPTETQGGFYVFDATQAETNANDIQIFPSSVTSNIQVISVPGLITTTPVSFGDDVIQTADNDVKISLIPTTPMRGTDSANTVVPPSVAQFNARTIPSADYFVVTDYTAPDNASITSILADTNELQLNQGDWLTATGFSTTEPDNAGIAANGSDIAALNDISVAQILSGGDIDTYSLEESLKLMLAANVGILSGAATNSILIQAADGSKTRLTASVDVDGNRTAVTKDATG